MSSEKRTALVTGAARGIGAAIATRMCELGARVALIDVDEESLGQQCEDLAKRGGDVHGYAGDVRDAAFWTATVADVQTRWGDVDILVNNAGVIRDNFIENVSESDWDLVLEVNLKGAFVGCRAVVPVMKAAARGSIVNIISRAWLGNVGQVNYAASKGGLVSLTRTLALELARDNITVNGVAPGLIDTAMTRGLPGKVRERLLAMQPGGRMGTVQEVAAAVGFLASDDARFITGQILHVDGGNSCGLLSLYAPRRCCPDFWDISN